MNPKAGPEPAAVMAVLPILAEVVTAEIPANKYSTPVREEPKGRV